jgi:hypothetical protein
MLRMLFGHTDVALWVLSEDEFLSRIDGLADRGFAGAPFGAVSVEAIDELGRLKWRAHYKGAAELAILARQIREGRNALARRRTLERP